MAGEISSTPVLTLSGRRKADGITARETKLPERTESRRHIRQLSTNRLDQIGAPIQLLK